MSDTEIRFLHPDEYSQWDSFVDKCPEGSIYNKSYWLKHTCNFKKLNPAIIALFNKNDILIAGFAFGYKKKLGLNVIDIPEATQFSSLLIDYTPSKYISKREKQFFEVTERLVSFLERQFDQVKMTFPPKFYDIRPFVWKSFRNRVLYTYQLNDLDSDQDFFELFNPEVKNKIRKGLKQKYYFECDSSREKIVQFYKLEQKSMERQSHNVSYSQDEFVLFVENLRSNNHVSLYTIYLENKPVASRIELIYKDEAIDWKAGADEQFFKTGLNQLLFYKLLMDLKNNKQVKKFDFCGANTSGIASYKSAYNFELVPYFSVSKTIGAKANVLFAIKNIL